MVLEPCSQSVRGGGIQVVEALGAIVEGNTDARTEFAHIEGAVESLVAAYRSANSDNNKRLELSLLWTVGNLVTDHAHNQTAFADACVTSYLMATLRRTGTDVITQAAAVDAILRLAEANAHARRRLLDDGDVIATLLEVVTRPAAGTTQRTVSRQHVRDIIITSQRKDALLRFYSPRGATSARSHVFR